MPVVFTYDKVEISTIPFNSIYLVVSRNTARKDSIAIAGSFDTEEIANAFAYRLYFNTMILVIFNTAKDILETYSYADIASHDFALTPTDKSIIAESLNRIRHMDMVIRHEIGLS